MQAKTKSNTDKHNLLLFKTTGFSMWPFLKSGEQILVKKVSAENLKIGDIMLYRVNDRMICHRLVRKVSKEGEYLFYTQGDTSLKIDNPVSEKALIGRVEVILKKNHILNLSGGWRGFASWFIVKFAPFLRALIRFGKWAVTHIRKL